MNSLISFGNHGFINNIYNERNPTMMLIEHVLNKKTKET